MKDNTQTLYSLTPLQEGLLYHSVADKTSSAYFIQASYRLHGKLDPGTVRRSLNELLKRHDILRTAFVYEGLNRAFQVVLKEREADFYYEDLGALPGREQDAYLAAFRQQDRKRLFDLGKDVLFRVMVFRLGEAEYQFIWSHHHILMDGWCTGILVQEYNYIYNRLRQGRTPELPPTGQYGTFIKWLERQDRVAAAGYWRQYLHEYARSATVPADRLPAPAHQPFDNREFQLVLPAGQAARLNALATQYKVTLNTLLQTAWGIQLSRYNNSRDAVFGTVVTVRPAEIEGIDTMIGLFINTIPVRIRYAADTTFGSLAQQVQRQHLAGETHQHYSLADIQAGSVLKQQLLDHIFVFGNYPVADQIEQAGTGQEAAPDISIRDVDSFEQVNYDFSIHVNPREDLLIRFNYNANAYRPEFIRRLAGHFGQLIEGITADPEGLADDLGMLSAAERDELLDLSGSDAPGPQPASFHHLFEQQVWQTPDAPAIAAADARWSYAELNARCNTVAAHLRDALAVRPGAPVAVMLDRSAHSVVACWAVLKAGGVYVPVDPHSPAARIGHLLGDVGAEVLITHSDYMLGVEYFTGHLLVIDVELDMLPEQTGNLPETNDPRDPAYVIYTSGTTGHPKGVPIRHESIAARILYHIGHLRLGAADAVLHLAALHFDASLVEIGMAHLAGGCLCIADAPAKNNTYLLLQLLQAEQVSVAILPPAYLKILNKHPLPTLRKIISTGEAATLQESVHYAGLKEFYNGYGPTETCIGATFHRVEAGRQEEYLRRKTIPIGKPFANTRVYVLDHRKRLLPYGLPGEICVAGIGVAGRYLNNPGLTAARFVPNPYGNGPEEDTLYCTGDVGAWNDHGELEYRGRLDEQVQIRGIRVEVQEIESVLRQHPAVEDALVLARHEDQGVYLVAYVCSSQPLPAGTLRGFAGKYLPDYMIPAYFTVLDAFPLNAGGKVDRNALPPVDKAQLDGYAYVPPSTPGEEKMAKIWEEILDREPVGIRDNFFEIGGHSLRATKLVSRIYRDFNKKVELNDVFDHPTVEGLSAVLAALADTRYAEIARVAEAPGYAASPAQKRIWVISHFDHSASVYNITVAYRLTGPLHRQALEDAIGQVVARHDSLRTTFTAAEGELRQCIHPARPAGGIVEYLFPGDGAVSDAALRDMFRLERKEPFDLTAGPLYRVKLVRVAEAQHLLMLSLHHIVSDGWSMQVLFREITAAYNARCAQATPALPPLRIQYKDYAAWQLGELGTQARAGHQEYWTGRFAGDIPVLDLPADFPRPLVKTYHGASHPFAIGGDTLRRLRTLAPENDASIYMWLLATLKTLLYRYTGQTDLVVGSPISGRDHPDLDDQVGLFVNTLALRTQFDGKRTFRELLGQVKQTVLGAFRHQAYPFDFLVDSLNLPRDISRSALFDVLLSHQNVGSAAAALPAMRDLEVDTFALENVVSTRFDLEFTFNEYENGITGNIIYNTDLFKSETIGRLARHFNLILEATLDLADTALQELPLLAEAERHQLLDTFNDTAVPVAGGATFVSRFEEQAAKTPGAVALRCENRLYTYDELNRKANRIAHFLRTVYGVQPEEAVCLYLERSEWLVIGMLGIMKAGGVYLPVDPGLPAERVEYILAQARPKLVFIGKGITPLVSGYPYISIQGNHQLFESQPAENPARNVTPGMLAYILFTSGSTGQPKGVMIEHQGMLNHLYAKIEDFRLDAGSIVAQTASQSFDVSVWQSLAALVVGGCTLVYTREVVLDPAGLMRQVDYDEVTVMQVVPSYLAELLDALEAFRVEVMAPHLKYLAVVGEVLHRSVVEAWFGKFLFTQVANTYGPTEASDGVSHYLMQHPPAAATVSIGKPVRNMRIYVLDGQQRLCPVGVKGELYLAGTGVGRGYLGEPAKTAEVFLEDPFRGGRMYRTGDLGRWLPDGTLEFLGRKDTQVKLYGHRIELGEVEQTLYRLPAVKEAVVLVKEDAKGKKHLCGYVTLHAGAQAAPAEIKKSVAGFLPAYMVPGHVFVLAQFPLTVSRKIDRKSLMALALDEAVAVRTSRPPLNDTETALGEIWQEVLGIEDIGAEDNFFEKGGHSFKAIRMQAMLYRRFGIEVPIKEVFARPTLQALAHYLASRQPAAGAAIRPEAASAGTVPAEGDPLVAVGQ